MSRVLFACSFDPPTLGHLNLIERGSLIFTKLFVAIAKNSEKTHSLLSREERKNVLMAACKKHTNTEVIEIEGLTVDFARQNEIDFLLRGIRPGADMEFEYQLASANRKLLGIETLFILADPQFSHISSSLIREIASSGHSLKDFVLPEVEYILSQRAL